MLRFQQPGPVDAELARDPAASVRRLLSATSGEAPRTGVTGPDGLAGAIAGLGEPERHAKIVVDPSLVAG
ncbi:hypothetical protein ACWDGI_31265 [Streptomyces sp. NPDC001220]